MRSSLKLFIVGMIVLLISVQCSQTIEEGYLEMDFNTEKIVGEWVKSWNTYDLNDVDRLFLLDSKLTYFSSEKQGIITGIEAVREHHKGFGFVEGGKEQPNKLWVEDLHTSTFGKTVVVTGIWFFQRPDGSKQRGPVTIVYVNVKDEFRIAHMNFSNYLESEEPS